MARSRLIKPGFFQNEVLGECHPLARLLFAGLWTEADREGRVEDRPTRLKVRILPYDDCDVDGLLDELASQSTPLIERYEVDGVRVLQIVNWQRHQSPHPKESESELPSNGGNTKSHGISGTSRVKVNQETQNPSLPHTSNKEEVTSNKQQVTSSHNCVNTQQGGFDKFWAAYPPVRRRDKRQAQAAFRRAVREIRGRDGPGGDDPEGYLLERAKAYARSPLGSGKFSKMPTTWLNGGTYDDDDESWLERGDTNAADRTKSARDNVLAKLEAMKNG